MRKDLVSLKPLEVSFLSCEEDTERLLKLLLVDSKPHSDYLKRLLIVNEPDCLNSQKYQDVIDSYSVSDIINQTYITTKPRIEWNEHENVKTTILLTYDNFAPNPVNEQYTDWNVNFDVITNMDAWTLDNYKVRPLQVCGYIDGIINEVNKNRTRKGTTLTGTGKYVFWGCTELLSNYNIVGYGITYRVTHFTEDKGQIVFE